jgi:hypothetical protein
MPEKVCRVQVPRAGLLRLSTQPHLYAAPQHVVSPGPMEGGLRGRFWPVRTGAMQDSGYGLPRTLFLKLSEKGYERRFERAFGGYTEAKMGRKKPSLVTRRATPWAPPGLFGQFL